jgi:translocation and assembly module TamA
VSITNSFFGPCCCDRKILNVIPLLLLLVWSVSAHAATDVRVVVEGLSPELEQNVRLFLSIEQQRSHVLLNEGRLRRLHQKARQEIEKALQPFGYYKPRIDAGLQADGQQGWIARYAIDPGSLLKISVFELKLNEGLRDDPEFAAYLDKLPLKVGDGLNHQHYESIKSGLLNLASERGYFDAGFKLARVEVDLQSYEARISIDFDAGRRYRFGRIEATQNILEPELLQRYIDFKSGDPYLFAALTNLRRALNDSDYFQQVEVNIGEPDKINHEVPVVITLKPRKPNRYSLGLGYGTDSGARGSLVWQKPLVNSRGHSFNTELKLSEIGSSLTARYSVPVLDPRTDRLSYKAGLVNESTDTSESRVETVGIALDRGRGKWRESLSLDYQVEEFEVSDIRDRSTLLIPGASWSRVWGGDLVITLDGIRLNLDLQGANKEWISDVSFLQAQSGIKFIKRVSDSNRLIVRGRLGGTWTDDFDKLPSSLRFFAGGAQSVRGYAYQSLGPEDADGDVEGGRYLMVGSVELDHRLNGNWGVALFFDAGNAINDLNDDLERGAGFGVRWQSPVGTVRIDLGSAISREGDPWRLHINIGPDL